MIEALLEGFSWIFSWPTILFVLAGTLLGQLFGVLPGLSGSIAMALLIPFTYAMAPEQGMALLASAMGAVAFGGSITAILFNTPGTANNAATCFDGFPLAKQGKAGIALGAGATASAMGALVGLLVLVLVIPVIREVVLAFGPPEFFLIAILGLTIISAVSGRSFLSSLIGGAFGLTLSIIGLSPIAPDHRFVFGSLYLWDGIQLVPTLIGIFAIAEMLNLLINSRTISEEGTLASGGILTGIKSVFQNFWLFLRCSIIGTVIGCIPGVGGSVANFVTYGHAAQFSKNAYFGQGDVRGVIAPEASNDAKDAGALMPGLALGIPGDPTTAVLLGGLMIHGINPGRELFSDHLPLIFTIVAAMVVANLLTGAAGIFLGNQLAKVTTLPTVLVAPVILILTVIGSFAIRYNMGDVILAVVFGIIGYFMIRFGLNRVPVILGLILGGLAEQNYHNAIQIARGAVDVFFTRPVSLVIVVLIVIFVAMPFIQNWRKKKRVNEQGSEEV